MNMKENSLSHIHLTREDLVGRYDWKGKMDLFNIIMIGLTKELPENNEIYELHRLLGALLSGKLTVDEKLNIIGNEYEINIENNLRRDVSDMCNLSQGLVEEGRAKGRAEGIAEGIAEGRAEGRAEGIAEGRAEGIAEGIAEERAEGIAEERAGSIIKMYNKGFTVEEIAETIDKDVEEVKEIIEAKTLSLV